ncbi:MAG: hypothetical protein PUB99_01425 [Oscillospiraceae bacterium]|nr:hypothetical protein [Oscillospiraceae bacterium]
MKRAKIFLCAALAVILLFYAGCGKRQTEEEPRPWAVSSTNAKPTETPTETTRSAELPTMETLETDGTSITLPMGVSAADIAQLEAMLWPHFFYVDYDSTDADVQDAMEYITDGSVPWGLQRVYDTLDPDASHGTYEQLSVETDPDPRSLFPDTYYKVDAAVVDFLLEDVLHCTPDSRVRTDAFYAEGDYYYFRCLATGVQPTEAHVRACQTLENGHYRITAELMTADPDSEPSHLKSAFLEVSIARTGALRHWTVYNVETFE